MTHGRIDYLQLPARDVARSAAFYAAVFGWSVENGSFEAPGMIGQWTTERTPSRRRRAAGLDPRRQPLPHAAPGGRGGRTAVRAARTATAPSAGSSRSRTRRATGSAWSCTCGRRRSQTLIAVRDVEASSRWYQRLLGLRSDHGGPHYERLLAGGELVLQLHHADVEHHHGRIGDPGGGGVLLWFGDVSDFDDVVARAAELGAPVVRAPHRNPPEGFGPGHREIWVSDPDGYTVVVASPDGEAIEPNPGGAPS